MTNERRLTPRFGARLKVVFHLGTQTYSGISRDISRDGIFICTNASIPCGSRLDLVIESSPHRSPIITRGVVVHRLAGNGVGVRFEHLMRDADARVAELLKVMYVPAADT